MASTLRDTLESTLSERPNNVAVRNLIQLATRMALAYLRQKARTGGLHPEYFGLSLEDLALDCCAELFERDAKGAFPTLRAYFEPLAWREMNAVDVQMALRRLVFSKVNEELFRRYRESDPNLAKIIRNIKDAVKSLPQIRLERQGREHWLVVGDGRRLRKESALIPPEFLEGYLVSAVGSSMQVKQAVAALVTFVRLRPSYRNGFPLVAFAQLVRSAFIRLQAATVEEEAPEQTVSVDEMVCAIESAMEKVHTQMFTSYVSRKKVDASMFVVYLHTVRSILEAQYVHDTSNEYSYFDIIATYAPSLSEVDYRSEHRNRVEYMVKLARGHVAGYLFGEPSMRQARST